MKITVCKTFKFEAAHQLPYHDGKCAHEHGHSYRVEVCVRGEIQPDQNDNPESGMVIDFAIIKEKWGVLDTQTGLDHRSLNYFMHNPTAERLCEFLVHEFSDRLKTHPKVELVKMRVYETDDCYAEWTRE